MTIRKTCIALFLFLATLCGTSLMAQNSAGMTGLVTDATGASVPGATVILSNKTNGLKFTQTTNSAGEYRFSNIPPAQGYNAVITASGFATVTIKDIYLTVSSVRTQNAQLAVSANTTEVEVNASASEVTIDTTTATIGNTFDVNKLNDLPIQQRNDPTALFGFQPGVTDTASVTGARSDQNNVTLDGLDVNDFATGGSSQTNAGITQGFTIVGHAPVDSVEEFRGVVGGLGADAGPSSGGQFSLVTKSGTNQFHGNINEYHRDPSLVANGWFNNNASPIVPRNHLIQNQFGGNIGGPIMRDKLFFFFDYNNSRIISAESLNRTVPLTSFRNGNITYINNDVTGATNVITPAQIAALDPTTTYAKGINTTWLAATNARFPVSNSSACGDSLNSGCLTFNAPNDDFATNYIGRVDANLNSKQKMFARFTISRENSIETPSQFPADPVTSPFVDRTYAFVIGHNWQIGNNRNNSFFIGETVQKYSYPITFNPYAAAASTVNPGGPSNATNWYTTGDGTGPSLTSTLNIQPNSQNRRVPIPEVGDNFIWTKGTHNFAFGGTFKDIYSRDQNVADYNSLEIGMGGHVFSLCGPTAGQCAKGNAALAPTASLRPSDIDNLNTSTGNTALYSYDSAFAFLLGRVANVQSDYNYSLTGQALPQLSGDVRHYRYYQTQVYASDSWKATPSLTLSYGVNYQYYSVPYETNGYETLETQSYNQYMGARISAAQSGKTGATAVPIINYVLGGKANGSSAPPLYQPERHLFAPRFAFAFNPSWDRQSVFNGSVGMVYDRTIINAVQFIQDADSYLFQLTNPIAEGSAQDVYDSIANDPRLDSKLGLSNVTGIAPPAPPKAPYAPFANSNQCPAGGPNPCGLAGGSAFNATIDPTLKTPYSISMNFGFQRAMPWNTVMKLSYAGRLGRRLLAQADANQDLDYADPVSGQLFSQAMASVTQQLRSGATTVTPQPWFENNVTGYGAKGTITNALVSSGLGGFLYRGDMGDFVQGLSQVSSGAPNGSIPLNVLAAAQFSENSFYTNKGSSSYNALLFTLQKNLAHGLQFDFNYTWAHSIDNTSFFANSEGDTGIGGVGLVCDDIRPRECRANSDFDESQYITADATYQLPFGRHRALFSNIPIWANELVGGWDISGITDWHTGQAWGTASNAFVSSFSNDAPAILVGSPSNVATHLTKLPGGGVNIFANNINAGNSYVGPVGFQIGARNGLRGPRYFNQDLGLAKTFPIVGDRVKMKFRADAFNALNHPNFALPIENGYNGFDNQDVTNLGANVGTGFGAITSTVTPSGNLNNGARVVQVSLRLEF